MKNRLSYDSGVISQAKQKYPASPARRRLIRPGSATISRQEEKSHDGRRSDYGTDLFMPSGGSKPGTEPEAIRAEKSPPPPGSGEGPD